MSTFDKSSDEVRYCKYSRGYLQRGAKVLRSIKSPRGNTVGERERERGGGKERGRRNFIIFAAGGRSLLHRAPTLVQGDPQIPPRPLLSIGISRLFKENGMRLPRVILRFALRIEPRELHQVEVLAKGNALVAMFRHRGLTLVAVLLTLVRKRP